MKKRLFPILITVLMVFAMMPVAAVTVFAESDTDTEAPIIHLDSLSVGISGGSESATVGDTVTLSVVVTDNRAVDRMSWYLRSPVSGKNILLTPQYAGTDEDTKNGKWEAEFKVDDKTENGLWKTYEMLVFDSSGNSKQIFNQDLMTSPVDDLSSSDFEVYGTSSDPDIQSPEIDLDSLSVSISGGNESATVGDTVTLSVVVTDNRAVDRMSWYLRSPVSGKNICLTPQYAGTDEDTKNGKWEAEFRVDDETENGLWKTFELLVFDSSGNSKQIFNQDFMTSPVADLSASDFEVYGTSSDPDIQSPEIDLDGLSVSISGGSESATAGDTVTLSVVVTDDRAVNRISWYLRSPVSGKNIILTPQYAGTDEDTKNGIWEAEFRVDDETENGLWKTFELLVFDSSGNSKQIFNQDLMTYQVADLSSLDFEVVAPECPFDLTTEGYSMMLDGVGATTTFGGNYYVNTVEESVTPSVKVRFDAEDGTWTTLAPRKYILKYEKKTSDGSWEDYTAETFGVDEDGTATYRVSATGKESLYYTGTVGPVEFNVIRKFKVTFDTSGGTSIDPQYVIPGGQAARPDDPKKDGLYFKNWYSDEDLTDSYWFSNPVNTDVTLYAAWYASIALGVYNQSNPDRYRCGTIDIENASHTADQKDAGTGNYNLLWDMLAFTAKPAEGYAFKGWYKGIIGDSSFVEAPSDELLTKDTVYICIAENSVICAVFECVGHQWEQKIQKATPDAGGRIYQVCSICGAENTEEGSIPLLKVSKISLEDTSFPYTGKAIEPKVIVANASEALSADCYTVTYSNNVNPGTATATVTLKGDYYEGSKTLNFTITPAPTEPEPTKPEPTPAPLKDEDVPYDKPIDAKNAPTAETMEKLILANSTDEAPAGSRFNLLQLRATKVKKNSIKIQWTAVKGATGYIIYGAKCGEKYSKLQVITTGSTKSWTQKKLAKGKYYKYYIIATQKYNGTDRVIASSKTIHIATSGGKVGNFKSVKLTNPKKTKIKLKVGKSLKIKGKAVAASKKLKPKTHRKLQYESTNPAIAEVSKKGKITAKKAGTCNVYVYAQNGVFKKIKVTVKK